jgi:exodeoxyribonuclease VII large subunit
MRQPFLKPQTPSGTVNREILSVSQLNRLAKRALESEVGAVWLEGEISNYIRAASGHWYFSLKDNQAQIKCAMFKFKNRSTNFSPNEGDKVVVKGNISLYEARGDYQLIVDYMEPSGLGKLQQQLNVLIEKLAAEGLFAPERKRVLPVMPKAIGVITSPTGAAIHDVLNVLKRRCPLVPVIIYPSQVQGKEATQQIVAALHKAQKLNQCDVILMTRGGGSLEDLWCFNDEQLAREIVSSKIPVVAAIGHEIDNSITELVADLRAPTPSAAAELLVPEQQTLWQKIDLLSQSLSGSLLYKLEQLQSQLNIAKLKLRDPEFQLLKANNQLESLKLKLQKQISEVLLNNKTRLQNLEKKLNSVNPKQRLLNQHHHLSILKSRLKVSINSNVTNSQNKLKTLARELNALSPLATLERGYSVTRDNQTQKVITKVSQVKKGQELTILVSDGEVNCSATQVRPYK